MPKRIRDEKLGYSLDLCSVNCKLWRNSQWQTSNDCLP